MADLIERLRAKAALSIPPHAPRLLPPGFRTPVYDAEMRALLTEAADALAQRAEGGEAMVERAAIALFLADGGGHENEWREDENAGLRKVFRQAARAALTAALNQESP